MTHAECASDLLAAASGVPSVEWRTVVFFYAGVHAVNALAVCRGRVAPVVHQRLVGRVVGFTKSAAKR